MDWNYVGAHILRINDQLSLSKVSIGAEHYKLFALFHNGLVLLVMDVLQSKLYGTSILFIRVVCPNSYRWYEYA